MRHKSTELMGTIKAFVEEYYMNYRHSPSTTQIADAVGIARGTAYKYLVAMNENGMIRYDGQQISTEQTEKVQTEFTKVCTTWCCFLRRAYAGGRVCRGICVIACLDVWQRDFFLT